MGLSGLCAFGGRKSKIGEVLEHSGRGFEKDLQMEEQTGGALGHMAD